jgi:hypothetical protein
MWIAVAIFAACVTLSAQTKTIHLTISTGEVLNEVPIDYTGLSYETVQLEDADFFSGENTGLIALFRRLSPHGVLRLGGNSSEFCWWKDSPDAQPPTTRPAGVGRADNWMPQNFHAITPKAIDNLARFLDATGWTLIYGLNFGTGSPARDASEAAYVAHAAGSHLKYFQIGNEPDFYHNANNMLRPAGWSFDDYMNEWTAIADAVTASVPDARFGGPDVGANSDWVVRFAQAAPRRIGNRIAMLSGHYYAMGPPDSPSATSANLLASKPAIAGRMEQIMPVARAAKLDFRMTEGNSCYRGGKPDVSNALASALWGGDYELEMASLGCSGINFHGGGGSQISASLGTKLPGVRNETDRKVANLGSFYTPIAGSRQASFSARPIFYGMMLAQQFAGTTLLRTSLESDGANVSAYAGRDEHGKFRVALFNKDEANDAIVIVDEKSNAKIWRLSGRALDATSGITLAGAAVEADGAWNATDVQSIQSLDGKLNIPLPHAGAALLFIGGD